MSWTSTPNLGLKLIDYDTEDNTWGTLTNQNWSAVDAFAGNISSSYTKVYDSKPNGTPGGTFTAGSWQTRDLNSIEDTVSWLSLASNQITLAAGTYRVNISCPAYYVNRNKAQLYNITDSTTQLISNNGCSIQTSGGATTSYVTIAGKFTIASTKTFVVQHRCEVTYAVHGFGTNTSFSVAEIYTTAEIWKLS